MLSKETRIIYGRKKNIHIIENRIHAVRERETKEKSYTHSNLYSTIRIPFSFSVTDDDDLGTVVSNQPVFHIAVAI